MGNETQRILDEIKGRLRPPTEAEVDRARARWLFGVSASRIMAHAPWSLVLIKLMWKKGEEPWEE